MKILCTGGRDYWDSSKVYETLDHYLLENPNLKIVVGCAHGLDEMVRAWCDLTLDCPDVDYEVFHARWKELGKKAGHVRNAEMIATKPDLVIAFPGGIGTANCVRQAKKAGIPVIEVE